MNTDKQLDIADLIIIFLKWKKTIISLVFLTMVISYLGLYFLVEEKYDANALIVPSSESANSIAGLLGGGLSNLPFDIPGMSSSPEVGMFKTVIYSRSMKDKLIRKFDLYKVFKIDTNTVVAHKKQARERLDGDIATDETDDGAFNISVRMPSPKLAADIANFIVEELNSKLIELKIEKSKDNRIFLGERLQEIRLNLKKSEDSLSIFQKKNKFFVAEEQIKSIISANSQFETELIAKELQLSVATRLYGKESPNLKNISLEVEALKEKLTDFKNNGLANSPFVSMNKIPEMAMTYFRIMRDIEINQIMLKFILPLYEQARIDEQKKIPILQVIDLGEAPEKKSYPPRTLFTLILGLGNFFIIFTIILILENKNLQNSEKFNYIKKNLFKWTVE